MLITRFSVIGCEGVGLASHNGARAQRTGGRRSDRRFGVGQAKRPAADLSVEV